MAERYEIIENQRWAGRWSGVNLLPLDPMRYVTNEIKVSKFPRDLEPPDDGVWCSEWEIDNYRDNVDSNGWTYGIDFPEFTLNGGGSGKKSSTSYVRRRIWFRNYNTNLEESTLTQKKVMKRQLSKLPSSVNYSLVDHQYDDSLPVLGVIVLKPLALAMTSVDIFDDDIYIRVRCRSPKLHGPGTNTTEWKSSRVLCQASMRMTNEIFCEIFRVGVTNPRTTIEIEVCRADDHKPLYSLVKSTFEIDQQMDNHAFIGLRMKAKDDALYWELKSCISDKETVVRILVQARFDCSYFDLVWAQRLPLAMAPENPGELSQHDLKELAERATNIVNNIVTFSGAIRSCISWKEKPIQTFLLMIFSLIVEWHIDATRILAIFPLLFVLFLLATLWKRLSGAWLQNWIQRPAPDAYIPCLHLFLPIPTTDTKKDGKEDTDDNENDSERSSSESKEKKKQGIISDFYAARAQVLDFQSYTLRLISYIESFLNLMQWVHPIKTMAIFTAALTATIATILLPLQFILISTTLLFYYDEFIKAAREDSDSPVIDARVNNFIRSVPDAADLVKFFYPSTRAWLNPASQDEHVVVAEITQEAIPAE